MIQAGIGRAAPPTSVLRAALAALMTLGVVLLLGAGSARASYGDYKVLLAEPYSAGAHLLGAQLATYGGVNEVDFVNTNLVTPTAAELAKYDLVVSVGDSNYADSEAWGDALASFVDAGGVVVQTAYDTWDHVGFFGRFETGGYEPFMKGPNVNQKTELGSFDATSPLMQGVAVLKTIDNTESEPAPGATLVARWANGVNAVAYKGRVVAISAFLGDNYGEVWSGDGSRIIYNALRTLGPQPPVLAPTTTPAPVVVSPPPPNVITLGKLKRDADAGTAKLAVGLPAAGTLVMTGKGVRRATATSAVPATVTIVVRAVGKAKKKLLEAGKVGLQAKLSFAPTGGTTVTAERKLTLRKRSGQG